MSLAILDSCFNLLSINAEFKHGISGVVDTPKPALWDLIVSTTEFSLETVNACRELSCSRSQWNFFFLVGKDQLVFQPPHRLVFKSLN